MGINPGNENTLASVSISLTARAAAQFDEVPRVGTLSLQCIGHI
jgi:hypothetical protein